jgi:hypothetical protein
MAGLPAEEWMISLTRTGHRCFIRLVKVGPELDDLIPVLLPMKRLTASTDSAVWHALIMFEMVRRLRIVA